ncbi:uncharacterized protein LOC127730500 [Mytilus californianus]|uniref:uncharacterized protein LOC127730500 n=1 Tax=Mytilus californianus TaxID=6549 RepID=UPI002247FB0D|nr:uncharacterized protein LOC127730500 [Mytilus californianus]
MRRNLIVLMKLGLLIISIQGTYGIKCWKCISDDCDGDPENNYKAEKVSCKKGESCLKVLYQMHDNKTRYESVIRTCSSGECVPTPLYEYDECLSKDHGYLVLGCSMRLCCHESMCNSSHVYTIYVPVLLCLSLFIQMI